MLSKMKRFFHPSGKPERSCVSLNRGVYVRCNNSSGWAGTFISSSQVIVRLLNVIEFVEDTQFQFGMAEDEAFRRLKYWVKDRYWIYTAGAETELHIDTSKYGYGAILLQRDNEDQLLHPIYYASCKTIPAKEKYASYELEVLAIVKALKQFRIC